MSNVLISICARGGSKGIPGKNARIFNGVPLLVRTINQARDSGYPFIVSTEDTELARMAVMADADVLTRPHELATETASKWDVFRHIAEHYAFDILVDLDVCCPLRAKEYIRGCLKTLENDNRADVVVTAYLAERNPYFNMVERDPDKGDPYYWVVCGGWDTEETYTRRQDAPQVWSLSPSVFAIRREALTLYSHWSRSNLLIYPIPRERAIDCDTELDFRFAEWLAKNG
jgi:CMP-N,N'-diacetyllegionaminic acid synthase